MLKIYPKKTKMMVFQKGKNKCDYVFHIGNEIIDIVQDYTFLGNRISSSGNFTLSLEHLRQKALDALFSLRDCAIIIRRGAGKLDLSSKNVDSTPLQNKNN